jgi:Na+/phosphate symporter
VSKISVIIARLFAGQVVYADAREIQTFVDLVAKMRSVQRQYFRSRDFKKLEEARQLEAQVDAWLEPEAKPTQGGLI